MELGWRKLPFIARTQDEFDRELTGWLSRVFYEILPEQGYEVREEQIYTTFRMARALSGGETLFAEAGAGTGKTFAYLLPAVCFARFRGAPVLVASASSVLQAQLANPKGDVRTLSRILGLDIEARLAADPIDYVCGIKAEHLFAERPNRGWKAVYDWAHATQTGWRSELPDTSDELWRHVAWDPTLPCDTCPQRGYCHVVAARRRYREPADLVITDHRLFARDLLTRAERLEANQLPLLPTYSAVVLDEGHHLPEVWQRAQGSFISAARLAEALDSIADYALGRGANRAAAEARWRDREHVAAVLVPAVRRESEQFLAKVLGGTDAGSGGQGALAAGTAEVQTKRPGVLQTGKQEVSREGEVLAAGRSLAAAARALQDELVMEEAMQEGTEDEKVIQAQQERLEDVLTTVALFQSREVVAWLEGNDLWAVPRKPSALFGPGKLPARLPVLFSSATLEPDYMARVLGLTAYDSLQVGVPFNLARQVLVYRPEPAGAGGGKNNGAAASAGGGNHDGDDGIEQVRSIIRAMQGRTLVLLPSMAEVRRYKEALAVPRLPWRLLFEGDADRGSMLRAFRQDTSAVLFGVTFWEGVDVPGESLSCVVIPRLPFPAHDPLIRERCEQAVEQGADPFLAVDVPEMLLKLKQGAGRLIRSVSDRGVLAVLDWPVGPVPWAQSVANALPEGAEQTADLGRVAAFCPPGSQADHPAE